MTMSMGVDSRLCENYIISVDEDSEFIACQGSLAIVITQEEYR